MFNILKREKSIPINKMAAAIELWSELYENSGGRGLNLAAAIAAEFARLTTIEMKIKHSDGAVGDALGEIEKNIRTIVELACAKGGIILKPRVKNGRILTDIVQADCFEPTMFGDDFKINGAVFTEHFIDGEYCYTRKEEHRLGKEGYVITNKAYISRDFQIIGKETPLSAIPRWSDLSPEVVIEKVDIPLFAYLRMPMSNNIDPHSPIGVSVYSRAIGLIEDAQRQYERLLWEFESGERALYIDNTALRRDRNGNPIIPDKKLYRMIDSGRDDLFEAWTPELRDESFINGLERILKQIEFAVGLAYGTISDASYFDKTAEEVRSSKQRSYATVCDIQRAVKDAICDYTQAAQVLCGLYDIEADEKLPDIEFDDSIIADRRAEFDERLELLKSGVITAESMRAWYLGEAPEKGEN